MKYIFISPMPSTPSGGVAFLYSIVRLLNEVGINAIIYNERPFRPWWSSFTLDEKYIYDEKPESSIDDVLVIPEVLWRQYDNSKLRKICFVQNWLWCPELKPEDEVLVCSRYLANYVQRKWNVKLFGKVTPFLDDIWYSDTKVGNSVLVYARRNDYWPTMVDLLHKNDYTVNLVSEPTSQTVLAKLLSTSDYYAHLSHPEGFPAASMEAMRSRAVVVGTTGGGGNELMHGRYETAYVVQDPDNGHYDNSNHEFQNRIIQGINYLRDNREHRELCRTQAYNWSLRYTADSTKKELKRIFS